MLTIVVSIFLTALLAGMIVGFFILLNCRGSLVSTVSVLLVADVVIGLCGCAYGIFGATKYTEWEIVEEIELTTLSNSTQSAGTGLIYVSLTSDNVYLYRYEIDSNLGTESSKEYKTATLSGDNIVEIEDSECKKATLKVYERTGISDMWHFALMARQTQYAFYVPEGSIQKEIKLG